MHNAASSTMPRHCSHAGMHLAVDLKCPFGLISIWRSTVSFLGCLRFLYLVNCVQGTLSTTYWSYWKAVTAIATVWYRMYFARLRQLNYRLWFLQSVKLANLWKYWAMRLCSSPFGIAHRSAKLSSILISGPRFFIIQVTDALVRGISLLRRCFAVFGFSC